MPLAAPGPGLVPGAVEGGPDWLSGIYGDGLEIGAGAYYGFLWLALVSYLAVLVGASTLERRLLATAIAALVLVFALAPPLLSADVFSYISYARLATEHGLDPYDAVPAQVPTDEAFAHVGWKSSVSAYGPLFTLLTYPLGPLGVPAALWAIKAISALGVLAVIGLTARLAALRGLDPRVAAAFVGLNPLVLVHVVGGGHNEALMMLLTLGGVAALAGAAPALAGAALTAATSIKISAAFALPFALLGVKRRRRFAAAAAAMLALVGAASLAAFGADAVDSLELAGENQELTTHFSIPSTVARAVGADVDAIRVGALALYAAAVAGLMIWTSRRGDWLRAAAWAAFGLLIATSWLLPWYLLWLLPLAALARDRPLAMLAIGLTAWELGVRVPV